MLVHLKPAPRSPDIDLASLEERHRLIKTPHQDFYSCRPVFYWPMRRCKGPGANRRSESVRVAGLTELMAEDEQVKSLELTAEKSVTSPLIQEYF
jgi:hypothetical protein